MFIFCYSWDVYDTETLMVDPSGDVILISKVQGGRGQVGLIPSEAFNTSHSSYNITSSLTLNIPKTDNVDPLGGDISPNGREVVLRTHHKIYYWMVSNGEYLSTLNNTEPTEVPQIDEPQGEAVGWDARWGGTTPSVRGKNNHCTTLEGCSKLTLGHYYYTKTEYKCQTVMAFNNHVYNVHK